MDGENNGGYHACPTCAGEMIEFGYGNELMTLKDHHKPGVYRLLCLNCNERWQFVVHEHSYHTLFSRIEQYTRNRLESRISEL